MPLNALFQIGKIVSSEKDELDMQTKEIKIDKKQENQEDINLKIVFDLKHQKIIISPENVGGFKPEDIKNYLYCGNNAARDKQYLLTREASKGLKYVWGKMLFDLKLKMIELKLNQSTNRLYQIVEDILASPLYINKSGQQHINFSLLVDKHGELVKFDKSPDGPLDIEIKQALYGADKKDIAGKNLVLIVPACRTMEDELVVLPQLNEYRELLLARLKTGKSDPNIAASSDGYCYVCQMPVQATCKHLGNFPRDSISKIFITDKINYAPTYNGNDFDRNYKFCESCRNRLLNAEKYVKNHLNFRLAGTSAYIIPAFLVSDLGIDYEKSIRTVKEKVDIAFNAETLKVFIDSIEAELSFLGSNVPINLNFLVYESDGNSIKIIEYIRDISEFKFIKMNRIFAEEHLKFKQQVKFFNLGTIYHLIPLKFGKDGRASSKRNNVLEIYANLLKQLPIASPVIYRFFCQALYHNFYNQRSLFKNIYYYDKFDFAIYNYVYNYLIFINSLKRLQILYEEPKMETQASSSNQIQDEKYQFIKEQGFNEQQQALFYLGLLINQVGYSQSKAGHTQKPILSKINYQGMSPKDIQRLYLEVFEKLVQYQQINFTSVEQDNAQFKTLFDRHFKNWKLTDEQNVFYLLSGYAF